MNLRGNEQDVTATVNTTDANAVRNEVNAIYLNLYPDASTQKLDQAFSDATRLYRGEYPGYHASETPYHNIQHVFEVTLAVARLINGYERGRIGTETINDALFRLGVIVALFHDCGYVRKLTDVEHQNGAEYTLIHVSRGSRFLAQYLPTIGMGEVAHIAATLIHFTGFEIPVQRISVPAPIYRLLGSMLGSADIIAQMADRCYLEKCRDRLYPEFVAGGLAVQRNDSGGDEVVFASGSDLVMKTPDFFRVASNRLNHDLAGTHGYAQTYFGGQHLYLEEVQKNIRFAEKMRDSDDAESNLNRTPPPN